MSGNIGKRLQVAGELHAAHQNNAENRPSAYWLGVMHEAEKLLRDFREDKYAVHELNTDPAMWDAVLDGSKTCEVRRDDRDFKVGDFLMLHRAQSVDNREYRPPIIREITHIVPGGTYGLPDGLVVLSMAPFAS